jgi:hypothetical protein
MTKASFAGGVFVTLVLLVGLAAGYRTFVRSPERKAEPPAAAVAGEANETAGEADHRGFLYGRVTTVDGAAHEGRLRFGGDQEAFWGDFFNGNKGGSAWVEHVPPERRPKERELFEIFGITLRDRQRDAELVRLFMARFGDIARIEAQGREVRVTLKSGTTVELDRFEASDFDDGVRVWDADGGSRRLESSAIRTIELLPARPSGGATFDGLPGRLHGTVRTKGGEFTGFVQWDREECVGSDELDGDGPDGDEVSVRFGTVRAIARRSADSSLVTLRDGGELVLAGTNDVGEGHRGVYVDDPRYGRVLVSWDAFERVDFDDPSGTGSGPAYDDFPPGRALAGSVATRDGRRLAGRLVFDLDESETTESLDAPWQGVDYLIPFDRVATIAPPAEANGPATVTLRSGEALPLESEGDLGQRNAGLLVFADGGERPEYVSWSEVARIDLDPPPATVPPLERR